MADWLGPDAKKALGDAVRSIESRSSAEIVVTVKRRSARYTYADLALGSVLALVALLVYAYAPAEFDDDLAPILIVVAWISGALLSRALPPVKRLFTTDAIRKEAVGLAARAAFLDQGIDRTSGRTGVLVYVSLLERRVELVADRGVPKGDVAEWEPCFAALQACLDQGAAPSAFAAALDKLGDPLGRVLPRSEDDVNELPDEVVS